MVPRVPKKGQNGRTGGTSRAATDDEIEIRKFELSNKKEKGNEAEEKTQKMVKKLWHRLTGGVLKQGIAQNMVFTV